VVIGVQDRPGGPAAMECTSLDANLLLRRIYELTTPPLTVEVQQTSRGLVNLLVVRVRGVPTFTRSTIEPRAESVPVASRCQPPDRRLLAERRGDDWSAEETERPLTDVSAAAIEQARGLLRALPDPLVGLMGG
jgi:ATP-dependent DNA helicase RecG